MFFFVVGFLASFLIFGVIALFVKRRSTIKNHSYVTEKKLPENTPSTNLPITPPEENNTDQDQEITNEKSVGSFKGADENHQKNDETLPDVNQSETQYKTISHPLEQSIPQEEDSLGYSPQPLPTHQTFDLTEKPQESLQYAGTKTFNPPNSSEATVDDEFPSTSEIIQHPQPKNKGILHNEWVLVEDNQTKVSPAQKRTETEQSNNLVHLDDNDDTTAESTENEQKDVESLSLTQAKPDRIEITLPQAAILLPPTCYRDRIVQEIVTTERFYVKTISILLHVFLIPMNESLNVESDGIDSTPLVRITSFLKNIFNVNIELLTLLEERLNNWATNQKIGDIFLKLAPFLKIYSYYTSAYERIPAHVTSISKHPSYQTILGEFQQKVNDMNQASLHDVFIMPIQRIPRYSLLLQEMVQHTEQAHPDFEDLSTSLDCVKNVANSLNAHLKQEENRRKIIEIQNRFIVGYYNCRDPQIVAPHREFIKEGELQKIGRKTIKKKTFFLFNDLVLWASKFGLDRYSTFEKLKMGALIDKEKADPHSPESHSIHNLIGRLKFGNKMELESVHLKEVQSITNGFAIQSPRKSFVVLMGSTAEKEEWYHAIQNQANAVRTQARTRPRSLSSLELGFLAPIWVPDYLAPCCHVCLNHFSVITRKHHCRSCGVVVCGNCSNNRLSLPSISKEPVRVCSKCFQKNDRRRTQSFVQL
eukprot:TRINITY_DN7369_c0_g1_i1.p1 TRINITY_DN7369_c0_g1~~TRINITY_DN7369_c0_g1_i1.p1  ORF type:complete len:704 (+),score=151.50 TRINITY_DN7369_c0_g1_i1:47-2158(+)